jgi:hypothetical protein
MSSEFLEKFLSQNAFWVIMGGIAITAIVTGCIKSVVSSVARERSRREIAAYIAEKAMTPEEGERLLAAGKKPSC